MVEVIVDTGLRGIDSYSICAIPRYIKQREEGFSKSGDKIKEILNILQKAGVPVGEVNTVDKIVEDPNIKLREMIVELQHTERYVRWCERTVNELIIYHLLD